MNNNTANEVHQKPSIDQNQSLLPNNTGPFFKEFTWYADQSAPGDRTASLIQDTRDVADGIAAILGMVEMSEIAEDCADRPLLSELHRGQLVRLAITSARMLSTACGASIEAANDLHLGRENKMAVPQ
jgi:hypothetical protein